MIFILKLAPYKHDILFALEETPEALSLYMRRHLGYSKEGVSTIPPFTDTMNGHMCMFDNGQSLIRLNRLPLSPMTTAVLVHEIVHAVSKILRRVGIEHTEETEEAYTYAIQDVTERAFRKIDKAHWK